MRILISNDDGITAKGINVLRIALEKAGHDVYMVAPVKEESGTGHGVTLHRPLRVSEYIIDGNLIGYAVDGKPSDCIKLACWGIYKDIEFDMIISGINRGENLGTDVLYSGTVSAAAEGALTGVKSIAISMVKEKDKEFKFETASEFVVKYIEEIKNIDFPKESLININVPNLDYKDLKGFKYTKQGDRKYKDNFIERIDPQGNKYYWLGGEVFELENDKNADFNVVKEGYVSITPINLNLTDREFLERMKKG